MSIEVYKFLHIVGLLLTVVSLVAVITYMANGGTKGENRWRRPLAMSHGIGLFFIFVSGFGLLAKLGLAHEMPWWAWIKLLIFIALGAALPFAYKGRLPAESLLKGVVGLAVLAAGLGLLHR